MAKAKREDVLEYLESANMLEVSELIKDIEEKFGVSAAAPVATPAAIVPMPVEATSFTPTRALGFICFKS